MVNFIASNLTDTEFNFHPINELLTLVSAVPPNIVQVFEALCAAMIEKP